MLLADLDNISNETKAILENPGNQLFTSSINVLELLQLYRIKKIKTKNFNNATDLFNAIENMLYIKIIPFSKEYVNTLSKLKITEGHNDPFDHSIISQAIAEKHILVSSDRKFADYTTQKLIFAYNKR
jgi:PIN domain nuclease of toxin-antitoxin system